MFFELEHTSNKARAGTIYTSHGKIKTPVFMPIGTQATVKAIEQRELEEIGTQIILGNTYHLYLRPGIEVFQQFGGLHKFMNWNKPILTDSGGFQIYSLADLRKIKEEGVEFRSHIDGSTHFFSPKKVIELQRAIGSDIMMVLDECVSHPSPYEYVEKSVSLTTLWAKLAIENFKSIGEHYDYRQYLFGIIQGGTYLSLREKSTREIIELDFDGYAIGGLAVGESTEEMYRVTEFTTDMIPQKKPRYLMGVGRPENILESIERGVDMFDCVMPTRNGRNAYLFTSEGILSMRNSQYKNDDSKIDESCDCYTCTNFSKAYLRHLFNSKEILALQLSTIHNLRFYLNLIAEAREMILQDKFSDWKKNKIIKISSKQFSYSKEELID